jgi:hypothetical protein
MPEVMFPIVANQQHSAEIIPQAGSLGMSGLPVLLSPI